jgi:hypothetical protein
VATVSPPIAVIDTNVFLDIISSHDANRVIPRIVTKGDAVFQDGEFWYRTTRARDGLLLAIYMDAIGATTFGSHGEMQERLNALVPPAPGEDGGKNWELDFVTLMLHLVFDQVLKGWTHTCPEEAEIERKNAGDQWLVDQAKRLEIPLVTNEGLRVDGTTDPKSGIRKKATAAGVQVFTPREFFKGKLDEEESAEAFQRRFEREAEEHVKGRTDQLHLFLKQMGRYFSFILGMGDIPEDMSRASA